MKKSIVAALLSFAAFIQASVSDSDFGYRSPASEPNFWFTPMAGKMGPGPALGIGLNGSGGYFMGSARFIAADEMCIMCHDSEEMKQSLYLLGFKGEGPVGYFALMSGLSKVSGTKKGAIIDENDGFFSLASGSDYEMDAYGGYGVAVVMDLGLTTRHVGIAGSIVMNMDQHNPGAGLFLSLPIGSIRN